MILPSAMKKISLLLLALTLAACASTAPVTAPAAAPAPVATVPLTVRATAVLDSIAAGRFDEATGSFAPDLKAKLTAKTLADVWLRIQQQAGSFKQFGTAAMTHEGANDIVTVPASFANATLNARVVYDQSGRVAGLFFGPR